MGARATFNINPGGLKSSRRVAHRFQGEDERVRQVDGDFYFWGHTFELMGDHARWQDLDAMLGRISDAPLTEWIDVVDLFD